MPPKQDPNRLPWLQRALEQFEGPLLRYAVRFTGDLERAREAVQDTFLKLWEADPETVGNHLAPWLFTVCRNRLLDIQKKERRMKPFSQPTDTDRVPTNDPTPAGHLESAQAKSQLLKAIAALPPNQQEVVRLKFQSELSYKEIAEVTGLSVSNVGYLLHTALATLRQRVEAAPTQKIGGAR